MARTVLRASFTRHCCAARDAALRPGASSPRRPWHLCRGPDPRTLGAAVRLLSGPLAERQTHGMPRARPQRARVWLGVSGGPGARSSLPVLASARGHLRRVVSALTRCGTFWWPLPPPKDLENGLCELRIRGLRARGFASRGGPTRRHLTAAWRRRAASETPANCRPRGGVASLHAVSTRRWPRVVPEDDCVPWDLAILMDGTVSRGCFNLVSLVTNDPEQFYICPSSTTGCLSPFACF